MKHLQDDEEHVVMMTVGEYEAICELLAGYLRIAHQVEAPLATHEGVNRLIKDFSTW